MGKKEKTIDEVISSVEAVAKKLGIELDGDRKIYTDKIAEVHVALKRNIIVEKHFQRMLLLDNKDQMVIRTIAEIQNDIRFQSKFLEYLIEKVQE